jgi:NAD(P)H-hydrate epimerase
MPIPVIDIAGIREWERATWATGQTEAEVIRRVGKCVGELAARLTRPGELVGILAGKGHNGEDAHCARPHLGERRVEVIEVTDPANDLSKLEALLSLRPALIIDGLFGIGINRPLDASWAEFINRLNHARCRVLAVDVPSGLNADSGLSEGAAVRAEITLTVGAPKLGLLRESAWPFVGRLEVTPDVGLIPCPLTSEVQWTQGDDFRQFPPPRAAASHKGTYGHLAILAGSLGFHGAAVLAARGAQRAQPGLITLYTQPAVYSPAASQLQAVMVAPWTSATEFAVKHDAILVGPGLADPDLPEELKARVRQLWRESGLPVVADASALAWLESGPVRAGALRVITPHPGEAGRLLGCGAGEVQADRFKTLRELSRRMGDAWVVLKGHQTLVGRSAGPVFVNSSGNPHLAQGGSGDVLSGFIAGLLAQPELLRDPGMVLRYAVWQHGAAADLLQSRRPGWVIEELAGALGDCLPASSWD